MRDCDYHAFCFFLAKTHATYSMIMTLKHTGEKGMKTAIKLVLLLLCFLMPVLAGAEDETYQKGLQLFQRRDFKNAVVCLEKYVEQHPDPAAYYMLGYASYELRAYRKSLEYFDAAYLIDPEFTYGKLFERSALPDAALHLIHRVLERSGAKEQISYYADIVGGGLPELQNDLAEQKMREELVALIRESYRFEKVYPSVVSVFRAHFHEAYLKSVLAWLEAPLGRKMTMSEIEANSPAGLKNIEDFGGVYEKIGTDRKRLLERIEHALHATEMNLEVVSVSLLEMLTAMQLQLPRQERLNPDQIDAIVGKIREMPRDQLTGTIMVSLAYTYRDLSDAELEAGIHFYETPAGKWFNDISITAITRAIGEASREIGKKIGKSLQAKNVPI